MSVEHSKPVARSSASHIKLSSSSGGCATLKNEISAAVSKKEWEKVVRHLPKVAPLQGVTRSGIVGIERKMQEKMESTTANINVAFQDLNNLMDKAKDMVRVARLISTKIKVSIHQKIIYQSILFKSNCYLSKLAFLGPPRRNQCRRNCCFQVVSVELGNRWPSDEGGIRIGRFLSKPTGETDCGLSAQTNQSNHLFQIFKRTILELSSDC